MDAIDRNAVADETRSRLESACAQASEGDYSAALTIVRSVKAESPGNIYVVALERQIQALIDLAVRAEADPAQQQVVLDTFPNLVERAADEAARAADSEDLRKTAAARAPQPAETERAAPRAPELQRLVEEFFKQAEACIRRGDLENASREINRVFIIDPGNAKAKAYEHTIARLVAARVAPAPPKPAASPAPPARPAPAPLPKLELPAPAPASRTGAEFVRVRRTEEPAAGGPVEAGPVETAAPTPSALEFTPDAPPAVRHVREGARSPRNLKVYLPFIAVLLLGVGAVVAYAVFVSGAEDPGPGVSAALPPAAEAQITTPPAVTPAEEQAAAEPEFTPIPSTPTAGDNVTAQRSPAAARFTAESAPVVKSPSRDASSGRRAAPDAGRAERKDRERRQNDVPPPKIELAAPATIAAASPAVASPAGSTPVSLPKIEPSATTPAGQPAEEPVQAPASSPAPFTEVMKEPQVVRLEKPRLDGAAMAGGTSGEVVVRVQIDIDGKPLAAKIVRSTNVRLNDAVVDAVMRSTYLPGQMASGPVRSWIAIPFRFK